MRFKVVKGTMFNPKFMMESEIIPPWGWPESKTTLEIYFSRMVTKSKTKDLKNSEELTLFKFGQLAIRLFPSISSCITLTGVSIPFNLVFESFSL